MISDFERFFTEIVIELNTTKKEQRYNYLKKELFSLTVMYGAENLVQMLADISPKMRKDLGLHLKDWESDIEMSGFVISTRVSFYGISETIGMLLRSETPNDRGETQRVTMFFSNIIPS